MKKELACMMVVVALYGTGCAGMKESPVKTMSLGDTTYKLIPLFADTFYGDMSNWASLNPKATWQIEDGALVGRWGDGGSAVWLKPVFEGDVLVSLHVDTPVPTAAEWKIYDTGGFRRKWPEGGKNLNLFLLCSGPKGENMVDCYVPLLKEGTGPNGCSFNQYQGYFFTFTHKWARFRYLPGYKNVDERIGLIPKVGRRYHLVALRRGHRVRYYIDGKLIFDYEDKTPHTKGQMGFCLWRNTAKIYDFRVYQIKGDTK